MNDREMLEQLQSVVIETLLERVSSVEDEIVYDSDGVGKKTGRKVRTVDAYTINQAIAMLKQNGVVAKTQSIGTLDKLKAKLQGKSKRALPKLEEGEDE